MKCIVDSSRVQFKNVNKCKNELRALQPTSPWIINKGTRTVSFTSIARFGRDIDSKTLVSLHRVHRLLTNYLLQTSDTGVEC